MSLSSIAQRSRLASKRHSFIVGFVQMILVSINWKSVANGNLILSIVFTLANTLYWQYVVRTAIHSTFWERLVYALGSAVGVPIGIAIHYFVLRHYALTQLATVIHK